MKLKEARTVQIGEILYYTAMRQPFEVTEITKAQRNIIFSGWVKRKKGKFKTKIPYQSVERFEEAKNE